jgi:uncharacterized protein (TIGR00369 family)
MNAPAQLSPEVDARIRESFARQGFMEKLGVELRDLGHGSCELVVAFDASLTQQHGFFHAGVAATLADNAAGYAGYSVMPEGSTVLTTEFKINLLAPARGEMMRARAEVIKPGRTLVIVRSEVYCSADGIETHVATALVTTMCLVDKGDGPSIAARSI